MQRYVLYAPLSFASLFLNAAAWRGRGRGRGGGYHFCVHFIVIFYFTGKAMHRFYHTLLKEEKMSRLN